jgi:hypothetical protein
MCVQDIKLMELYTDRWSCLSPDIKSLVEIKGSQMLGVASLGRWRLVFVDHQYRIRFLSPFCHLEFWRVCQIFRKVACCTRQVVYLVMCNVTLRRVHVTVVTVEKQYNIYWVCVCVLALVTQHAKSMRHIVFCSLSLPYLATLSH